MSNLIEGLELLVISLQTLLIDAVIALFFSTLVDAIVVDRILQIEYELYRWHWDRDHKPSNGFWMNPGQMKIFRQTESYRTYRRYYLGVIAFELFLSTPDWMDNEPGALKMLQLHRVLTVMILICFLVVTGIVIKVYIFL